MSEIAQANLLTCESGKRLKRARQRPQADRWAYAFTIRDAQAMGGPGRTSIYNLAKQGRLRLVKVGGRTMVDGDSLRALLGVMA